MTDNEMLQAIYKDTQEMKRQIKDVQLTLENETNPNIRRVAEGHLDLSRKLDDALPSMKKVHQKYTNILKKLEITTLNYKN